MKKRFISTLSVYCVAVIAALVLILNFTKAPALQDGVWAGTGNGRNGDIQVSVTVKGGKIIAGKVVLEDETDFAKPAAQEIIDQAVGKGHIKSYDAVSGATITSNGTAEAIKNALAKASGKSEKAAEVKNGNCDIVIIGAGGAGLAAAIEGVQNGAKVIVLEKMGVAEL